LIKAQFLESVCVKSGDGFGLRSGGLDMGKVRP
jgi:hypothetical protein